MLRARLHPLRPGPVRTVGLLLRYSSTSSTKASDPLRILFCGSDDFSCHSLRSLHAEHVRNPSLISSIDVVARPGKPTGRGLRRIRVPPIKPLAEELCLPVHERDTFTGWTPPTPGTSPDPINLIIAVSFGLFVPPRVLRGAKYGGLNVHPSLLPDFRGPAPLQHTLLTGRTHTGVTLQTLDEHAFDHGTVLAQTPLPGVPVPEECTLPQIHELLAPLGAELLVQALRDGAHVPPRVSVGWQPTAAQLAEVRHAPKITKLDSEVDWGCSSWARDAGTWTASDLARRFRALGLNSLWTRAVSPANGEKRVIWEDVEACECPAELGSFVQKLLSRQISGTEAISDTISEGHQEVDGAFAGVNTISWAMEDYEAHQIRHYRIPYTTDGESIIIPVRVSYNSVENQGSISPRRKLDALKIKKAKVEGEQSKPAGQAMKQFAEGSHEDRDLFSLEFAMNIIAESNQ
ncbi:putative methionyl-trna formyltransferase protein [Phaeoacremonium minimum UCRPA7]|uniref:methionyl-tRNA formyltransferase n=1 Tax=Phaeoacremonium minimum (strain UCR-PA7) TaxID=1286976 RepID=R8BLW9_PHAM7|nr:putative methionyl-trna formyltransferase protein [Phaeoacremonium minimum UCRPA7]EOO00337.1 putative methionyl-trna formyltransferase protein [Phaeoacremonium minimum UCRPA7]